MSKLGYKVRNASSPSPFIIQKYKSQANFFFFFFVDLNFGDGKEKNLKFKKGYIEFLQDAGGRLVN